MSKKQVFSSHTIGDKEKCKNCNNKPQCIDTNNMVTTYGILIDCEGFYYVFFELEKIEQPPRLDADIEKNKQEIDEYEKAHENLPCLTPPLVTNGALALELAMMFLIFSENKEFEYGHDLAILYSQIPEVHSEKLKTIYKELSQDENTFDRSIKQISNVFQDYRYFFEHEAIGYSNFFNGLVHIVCDYAISMKEEVSNKIDGTD